MPDSLADLVVKIRSDTSGFQTTQVNQELSTLQGKLRNAGSGVREFGQKMTQAGTRMTAFVSVPLLAAGNKLTTMASDLNESVNAVNTVFGKAATKIKEFGKTSAQTIGLSTRAFQEAVTPIGAAFRNYGLSADQSAEASIKLSKRASDMASVFNTDVNDALVAIQAAFRGEADPIERYGVNMSAAAVEAEALSMGIKKSWNEMSTQEKTAARLSVFMKQTDRISGDFVNTSGEVANASRISAAEAENQAAAFGQKLIPVKAKLVELAGKLLDVFTGLPPAVQNATLIFAGIAAVAGPVMLALGGITQAVGGLITAMGILVAHPFILVAAAIIGAGAALIHLTVGFDEVKEAASNLADDVMPRLREGFSRVQEWAEENWPAVKEAIIGALQDVEDWVRSHWPGVRDEITEALESIRTKAEEVWPDVRDQAVGAFEGVRDSGDEHWPAIKDRIGGTLESIGEFFTNLRETFRRNWDDMSQTVGNALTIIGGMIAGVVFVVQFHVSQIREIWDRFGGHIIAFGKLMWESNLNIVRLVMGLIRGVLQVFASLIKGDWSGAWEGIKIILSTAWDFIKAQVSLGVQFIWLLLQIAWETIQVITRAAWNAIWGTIRGAWDNVWETTSNALGLIGRVISSQWRAFKRYIVEPLDDIRKAIGRAWVAAEEKTREVFRSISRFLGNIWDAIVAKVKGPINKIIGFVNTLIRGINTVLKKIPGINIKIPEVGKIGEDKSKKDPRLASGGYVPVGGGFETNGPTAIVGEGRQQYPEFVIPTDPQYRSRAMGLFGALQDEIMPQMGIGGIVGDFVGKGKDFIGGIAAKGAGTLAGLARKGLTSIFDPIAKRVINGLGNLPDVLHLPTVAKGAATSLWDWVKGADSKLPKEQVGGFGRFTSGGPPGKGVERWRSVFLQALRMAGMPSSWVNSGLRRMQQESGGNPRAINLWDSNAAKGIPSKGLMQTIDPTFNAYAGRLRGRGIWDPLANIFASINYANARYGQAPIGWNRPGGYATGGLVGANGGITHPGEMVLTKMDQVKLFKMVREGRSGTMAVAIEPGAVVINARGASEDEALRAGRAGAKGFLDVLAERRVLTDAKLGG